MPSLIMVRTNIPTDKQKKYFGEFAWRPYLLINIDDSVFIDDTLIRKVIYCSMYDEPAPEGVDYKKYFDIKADDDVFFRDFQFAFARYDNILRKLVYDVFQPIQL